MAGYTRQDTTGQLANGNPIDADIFNDEYDAIEGAFNASTGHTHDGTAGGGAPIESIGPSQELEVTSAAVFPKVDNLIDHGKSTLRWKTGYYGTDVIVGRDVTVTRDVSVGGDLTVTGDATISGNLILGDASTDTINFNADAVSDLKPDVTGTYNLGSSTQEWNNLWLDGTANVDFLTVDEDATIAGTLDVIGATGIDGDFDINTTKFTIAAASGNTTIAGTLGVADVVSVTDLTSATSTSTGAVVVSGGVGIAENLHVGGTLDVTGDVTFDNLDVTTLDASGAVGVDGNFDVNTTMFTIAAATGNTAIAGTLDVAGDTTVENLTVNGNTVLGNASADTIALTGVVSTNIIPSTGTENLGSASAQWNNLYVDGTASIDTLAVDENATVAGTLGVTGAVTFSDTLSVTSAVTATGGVTGDLTGDVTGNVTGDVTGNADTATALETARTIAGQSFDGTANIAIGPTDLTGVTATAAEINILDGNTAATSTTVVADDRVVLNDSGTMKQVSMSDIATYTSSQVASPNDATVTISAGSALTGGGSFTVNQSGNSTITVNHQDTSSQSSVNNSGATVIQDITLDTYGHITGINSTTLNTATIGGVGNHTAGTHIGAHSTNHTVSTGIGNASWFAILSAATNAHVSYNGTTNSSGNFTYYNTFGDTLKYIAVG